MRTYFYTDEVNDDFAFAYIRKQTEIKDDYKYINKNILFMILEFIVYRIIMTTIAFLSCKRRHIKIKNKKIVKKEKGKYFLYGNHTQVPGDAYIPNLIGFPRKSFIVVNPDSLSVKGTAWFIKMSGSLPTPTHTKGLKNFMDAMDKRVSNSHPIVIYPEAHLWPYYTKIRPYKSTSFRYPIKFDKPAYCFTTTYKKRKLSKKPKITVYVDGPFYYNKDLSIKEAELELRNQVYECMKKRSELSNYEYYKYIKRNDSND